MSGNHASSAAIAVVSFSLSHQTGKVVREIVKGAESAGIPAPIPHIRLVPSPPIPFPFPSVGYTVAAMVKTLFRARIAIEEIDLSPLQSSRLLILAGPTWSYNPSGPMLSFLDRYGELAIPGKRVLPVISCRGYWRLHWRYLRERIRRMGGTPLGPWVFTHPVPEPWRTIGVFLTVAGKHPRRFPWLKSHYPRYGHDARQLEEARRMGTQLPELLTDHTPTPLPRIVTGLP